MSIEPDKSLFKKFLLPLKNQYKETLFLLNDFAGEKACDDSKLFIENFQKITSDNSGFLFIDADFKGISVIELLQDIILSFNLDKFNMILLELSNNPLSDKKILSKILMKDFSPLKISKKRYLFIRKI